MLRAQLQRLGLDRRLKAIYERYERVLIPAFLVIGFIFDVITFRTLQIDTALKLLLAHAIVAGLMLIFIQLYDARKEPSKYVVVSYARFLAPFAAQISIGALLSSSLLFYWFSGSLSVSWPLFALITGVMISSEVFRQAYLRPVVQLSVYNFVLLSYFSVLLPFVLKSLSAWIFILSGVLSTLIVLLIILLLTNFSPAVKRQQPQLFVAVMSVFVIMSAFYYLKLIPPLPLSLREAGIYHAIIRQPGDYKLIGENETFIQKLIPGQTIHADIGDSLYAYTAIFAPAKLTAVIYHRWEYKDPTSGQWTDKSLLHFSIKGGRQEGFRGYTMKTGVTPGKWRVTVQNERGQVLGRLTFTVEEP
ncbi:MAG: DUF2914 domain-containing protein [Patescibacteria group bacterium]|mgnify:CR=1 FL=1